MSAKQSRFSVLIWMALIAVFGVGHGLLTLLIATPGAILGRLLSTRSSTIAPSLVAESANSAA